MTGFLSFFVQIVCLLCVPPILFGLLVWACRKVFCMLVGDREGRPLLLAVSVLSTPLRELGHVIGCVICLHRVEDMRLLDIRNPDGELGYVEHSYHPHNPIAIFGNFVYALAPVALGLSAVLLIFVTCFHGVLSPFFAQIGALGATGSGFLAYVKAAVALIPAMFSGGATNAILRVIGCVLLLLICFAIYVSPAELKDALAGGVIFGGLCALVCAVLMLLDERVQALFLSGVRAYATGVTALFVVVLLCAAALLSIGFVFGLYRTLFVPKTEPDDEV